MDGAPLPQGGHAKEGRPSPIALSSLLEGREVMIAPRMPLEELLANYLPGHRDVAWTWEDEERDITMRVCLCCGRRGHYQQQLEAYVEERGLEAMGVCLGGAGYLWDGHHRVIAAKHLGISDVPLESRADADTRWVRDHGARSWEERLFGDVAALAGAGEQGEK